MLTLALALALAQTPQHRLFLQPNLPQSSLAFFEAFPASGAGTYGACPVPNWALQSESVDNAAWTKTGGGGAGIPSMTPDFAVAPDGTTTAERVQFGATSAAQQSIAFQTTATPLGPQTVSIYVKGNGTSGTLDLWAGVPQVCSACSYNASTWTRCTATATVTSNGYIVVGNDSTYCSASRPAQDVLLWGGMVNQGSTAAPYVKTTTAPAAPQPTGARGEALTFSRTGSATCTKTASGGLATTGIANGDLVSLAGNVARVEYDSQGYLGLLVESARTNVLLQSDALGNAVYSDVATPTLTGTQTDPYGATSATAVLDNDGAAYEGRQQTVTVTAGQPYIAFCYVKAGTTDKARISLDGTAANISGLSATTWSIIEVPDASASGAAIVAQVLVGNATTDTGSVIFGGCDVQNGTYRTSHIVTAGAAAIRNTDSPAVASVTPSTVATGSMSLRVQLFTTATNGLLATDATGAWKQGIVTLGGERAYVGAVSMVGPLAALTAGAHTAAMWWDGSSTTLILDGAATSGAAGTPVATNQVIIGGYNGSNLEPGLYSRICMDPSPTRCR